jgi:hypothetical protein
MGAPVVIGSVEYTVTRKTEERMGLFGDEKTSRFGETLAEELARRFPPEALDPAVSKREANAAKALEHITSSANAFRRDSKVGVLKQIGLSRKFQDKLAGLGYEDEFIKAATVRLAQALSGK